MRERTFELLRLGDAFEVSLHSAPRAIRREAELVFPDFTGVQDSKGELSIILTCQRANVALTDYGREEDDEKDVLLERFTKWAGRICGILQAQEYWADYVDPCSGLAGQGQPNYAYSEVEGLSRLRGYRCQNAGGCKIVMHPQWGSSVYPASIFTSAPVNVLRLVIEESGLEPIP